MAPKDRINIDTLPRPSLTEVYQTAAFVEHWITMVKQGAPWKDPGVTKHQVVDSKTPTECRGSSISQTVMECLVIGLGSDELAESTETFEEMEMDLLRSLLDTMMKQDETVYLKRSPEKYNTYTLGRDGPYILRKGHRMSPHLQNNALPLLVCYIAEDNNDDNLPLNFHGRHGANEKQCRWNCLLQNLLLKEDAAIVSVIGHPDKRNGRREQRFHDPIQVLVLKTEVSFDEESEKFSYIRGKRQRFRSNSLTDGYGVVDLWRPEDEVVFISGPSSRQVQILEGPPESKSFQEQDQHTAEEKVTDPDDSHGDEDDEDQDYFARMTEAYKTNFCEEAADLFIRTMETGRWDDIVRQLNFTKPRADQLFGDSVTTLKQKAGEAYDSHPHHSSPPESLFRLQEDLVREAVLALAQQCRQQNVMSPQAFGKKISDKN